MAAARYSQDVLQSPTDIELEEIIKLDEAMHSLPPEPSEDFGVNLDEAIQSLPTEIREKIYKELVRKKMRERKEMGWNELHYNIEEAPFCEKLQRITKVCYCRKCTSCGINRLCYECFKKGENHYLDFPFPKFETHNENFQKFY